jgi:HEAT repeat protein
MKAKTLVGGVVFYALIASAQNPVAPTPLPVLLSQFSAETDRAVKERTLIQITTKFPEAGPDLLALAEAPENGDTNWMAIRGIGYLKFAGAEPFLKRSLTSKSVLVRANSARSLGEIGDASAIDPLIVALSKERDSGIIEQTSLALRMLHGTKAIPTLKSKIGNPSPQTRIWILGTVEVLGGRAELPFVAASLQDPNIGVRDWAARSVERLSGQDFGFPACGGGPCAMSEAPIMTAQNWWLNHKQEWRQ